jgi:cellulose synthase/poly-beta-1,6-N-acetylglucosamine synthase-like glycosyltransferase
MEFIVALHALCVCLLSAYALHHAILLALFLRSRAAGAAGSGRDKAAAREVNVMDGEAAASPLLPTVTIQIPLYNERFVAERAIAAAAAQDYPRDRLRIQVLDDSTDDTTCIAHRAVEAARARGVTIELIHRTNRTGYKAGALAAALAQTDSDLIAIFDADFMPRADFLRRVIVERDAFADPCVGFVQTCWDFLNREATVLTRAQAMTLDVHFVIEQPARNGSGLMINFNGSGGIWRRRCIEDAGGWHADTLTEDLDLSYRAELRGWRGVYLADEASPNELPTGVLAYKRQQARWARGTLQTVRKLMPHILRSTLPARAKLAAWMHLSGYFIHPLILITTITTPLLLILSLVQARAALPLWVNALSLLSIAPIVSMFVAHAARRRPLLHFLRDLPFALMLGIGVSFSDTVAMTQALVHRTTGEFARTPKTPKTIGGALSKSKAYLLRPDWTMWIELGLAIYAGGAMVVLWQLGYWLSIAPMVLYALGFGGVWLNQVLGSFGLPQE